LLHVSATHGLSSGNIYYWGDHCTVHFVFCTLRHINFFVVVNFICRIYPLYLFGGYFSLFLMLFTLLCMLCCCLPLYSIYFSVFYERLTLLQYRRNAYDLKMRVKTVTKNIKQNSAHMRLSTHVHALFHGHCC
jgi:hypothetical protein